jgi:hypothetical protein
VVVFSLDDWGRVSVVQMSDMLGLLGKTYVHNSQTTFSINFCWQRHKQDNQARQQAVQLFQEWWFRFY